MSTSTTYYQITKPAMLEEVNAFTLATNIQYITYLINRIRFAIYHTPSILTYKKTTVFNNIAPQEDTYTTLNGTWVAVKEVSDGYLGESGYIVYSNGGTIGWIQPGYYRLGYRVTMQTATVGSTSGSIRAGVYYWDNNTSKEKAIPTSFCKVPIDTYTGLTHMFFETIIKVVEQSTNVTDGDVIVHGNNFNTSFSTSGTPDWTYKLRIGHNNTENSLASQLANEVYFMMEFVRPL